MAVVIWALFSSEPKEQKESNSINMPKCVSDLETKLINELIGISTNQWEWSDSSLHKGDLSLHCELNNQKVEIIKYYNYLEWQYYIKINDTYSRIFGYSSKSYISNIFHCVNLHNRNIINKELVESSASALKKQINLLNTK